MVRYELIMVCSALLLSFQFFLLVQITSPVLRQCLSLFPGYWRTGFTWVFEGLISESVRPAEREAFRPADILACRRLFFTNGICYATSSRAKLCEAYWIAVLRWFKVEYSRLKMKFRCCFWEKKFILCFRFQMSTYINLHAGSIHYLHNKLIRGSPTGAPVLYAVAGSSRWHKAV